MSAPMTLNQFFTREESQEQRHRWDRQARARRPAAPPLTPPIRRNLVVSLTGNRIRCRN